MGAEPLFFWSCVNSICFTNVVSEEQRLYNLAGLRFANQRLNAVFLNASSWLNSSFFFFWVDDQGFLKESQDLSNDTHVAS